MRRIPLETLDHVMDRCAMVPIAGCWLWLGGVNRWGYGVLSKAHSMNLAHRHAYRLAYGDFPQELRVLHRCDTPACVNPAHLFLGTQRDNIDDMMRKGRVSKHKRIPPYYRGEDKPTAKLTWAQVREMRRLRTAGATTAELSRDFGICYSQIQRIVNGSVWKELDEQRA